MKIEHGNAIIGKTLFEINQKMKMNILICAIVRDKNIFIPNGDDIVKEGDVLYITGSPKAINESLEKMNIKVIHSKKIGYFIIQSFFYSITTNRYLPMRC